MAAALMVAANREAELQAKVTGLQTRANDLRAEVDALNARAALAAAAAAAAAPAAAATSLSGHRRLGTDPGIHWKLEDVRALEAKGDGQGDGQGGGRGGGFDVEEHAEELQAHARSRVCLLLC